MTKKHLFLSLLSLVLAPAAQAADTPDQMIGILRPNEMALFIVYEKGGAKLRPIVEALGGAGQTQFSWQHPTEQTTVSCTLTPGATAAEDMFSCNFRFEASNKVFVYPEGMFAVMPIENGPAEILLKEFTSKSGHKFSFQLESEKLSAFAEVNPNP